MYFHNENGQYIVQLLQMYYTQILMYIGDVIVQEKINEWWNKGKI